MLTTTCLLFVLASAYGNIYHYDDVEYSPPVPEFPGIDPELVEAALVEANALPTSSSASPSPSSPIKSPESPAPYEPASAPPPDLTPLLSYPHSHLHGTSFSPPASTSYNIIDVPDSAVGEVNAPPAPYQEYGPPGYSPPPLLTSYPVKEEERHENVPFYRINNEVVFLENSPATGKYALRIYGGPATAAAGHVTGQTRLFYPLDQRRRRRYRYILSRAQARQ